MVKKIIKELEEETSQPVEEQTLGVTKCYCGNIATIRSAKGNVFCCLACQTNKGE